MTRPPVVDRPSRDRLALVVRKFLARRITTSQFDDEICDFFESTEDSTVLFIADALSDTYDVFPEHYFSCSKSQWDYLQRLLLVLESDGQIVVSKTRYRWTTTQAAALAGLVVVAAAAVVCLAQPRLDGWWLLLLLPIAALSMLIARLRGLQLADSIERSPLEPFASYGELSSVRRRTSFDKERFSEKCLPQAIRIRFWLRVARLGAYAIWIVLAPLALLLQSFPNVEHETRVST